MLRTIARAAALAIGLAAGGISPAPAQQGDAAAVAVGTVPMRAQVHRQVARPRRPRRGDEPRRGPRPRDRLPRCGPVQGGRRRRGRRAALPDRARACSRRRSSRPRAPSSAARPRTTLAVIQLQRAQELLDRNSGTVVARDQARAQEEAATGAIVAVDEANLQTAQINLGYTQHQLADHRPDRPHERDQGQRRRARTAAC